MTTLRLNIYSETDKSKVEKTYTSDGYDLMLGTTEDILGIIDFDKMNDQNELIKMILKGYGLLKPLLKDIFTGLTDEELRQVKFKELIPLFQDICMAIAESFKVFNQGN